MPTYLQPHLLAERL